MPRRTARAGCIVTIGDDGEFRLYEGLVERAARATDAETGTAAGEATADGDEAFPSGAGGTRLSPRPLSGEEQVRKQCGFSQALVDDLKAHRLQIAKAHLAHDFAVAFDLALYALCTDLVDRGWRSRPLDLRAVETRPSSSLNDLAGTPADRLLEARQKALPLDWLALPPAEGFAALAALPPVAKQTVFAWCIAATLKPQLAVEDGADPVIESVIQRLAIPFGDFWRPTAANYWGRAKKAHGLAIAEAVLGPRWAHDHADDKKAALAAALDQAFGPSNTDSIALDQAARDAAAVWLPPGIAAGDGVAQGGDGDPGPDADPGPEEEAVRGCPQAPLSIDPWDELAEADAPSADLPAFLTGEDPAPAELDAALAG
jgi:ParB family transcriptional regulator, chromosome partitioning protein